MRTTIKAGEEGYERFIEISVELAAHRKAMRALKKERDTMLGKPVPADRVPGLAPGVSVTIPPTVHAVPPATFSAAPAGAPRAMATTNPVADKVRALFQAHPGVAFSASGIAQAIGVGDRLRGPAHEAVKALVRAKEVSEVGRNKYARVQDAKPEDLSLPTK